MKFLPDKDEALALIGLWMLGPALLFARFAFMAIMSDVLCGALPMPKILGIELLMASYTCIPQLTGSVLVLCIARWIRDPARKQMALHAVTLGAFGFAVCVLGLLFV